MTSGGAEEAAGNCDSALDSPWLLLLLLSSTTTAQALALSYETGRKLEAAKKECR